MIKKELELSGVQMITGTRVKAIKADGVVIDRGGAEQLIEADTVVLATGYVPDISLYESIKNLAPEVYVAGMAAVTGHTIAGIGNAFEVAMKI